MLPIKSFAQNTNDIFVSKTYEKNNNIFVASSDGKEKQLTFQNLDTLAVLNKNKDFVIFVRKNDFGCKILNLDIKTLNEETIIEKLPYIDCVNDSDEINYVRNLTYFNDNIYFISNKYCTSDVLIEINLRTNKFSEVCDAESFQIIKKPKHFGQFLIAYSAVGKLGRAIFYKIIDINGSDVIKFTTKEKMKEYFAKLPEN